MRIRDWLCKREVGRLLLSCDARPRMKSRYWLSCSRRGSPLRTSFGYRPLVGCNFDRSVGIRIGGTERRFVYRNYRSISRKGVATENGWLCSEIGVFSHMSCEVELLYDRSGVKSTFEFFTRVLSISKGGVVVYLLSRIADKLSIGVSVLYSDLQ